MMCKWENCFSALFPVNIFEQIVFFYGWSHSYKDIKTFLYEDKQGISPIYNK